ncbi:MAG: hypothetical protein RBR07_06505 [Arcobacteraceae bacterium]|nr:hypothetical protein [Arcobacteraceae bacterium]
MKRVSLSNVQDLGYRMSNILEMVKENKDNKVISKTMEEYVKDLMSMIAQNNVFHSINLIERVVETGERTNTGLYKQFHVSALELFDESKLLLRTFQIVDYDREKMKFILSDEITLIDFRKISRIY